MSGHSLLYHSLLRGHQESPQMPAMHNMSTMSPMSSLAFNLHHNLSHNTPTTQHNTSKATPKRRLSLTSNISDTSCHNVSQLVLNFDNVDSDSSPDVSPTDSYTFQLPPLSSAMSPPRRQSKRSKDNYHSPYFSPSYYQNEKLPFESEGALNNENFLNLSGVGRLESPLKLQSNTPPKLSSPVDSDSNSQDSGYSSEKKDNGEDFSVPADFAPRKLNLDSSPPKFQYNMSPYAFNSPLTRPKPTTNSFSSTPIFGDDDNIFNSRLTNYDHADVQPTGLSSLLSAPIDYSMGDSYSAMNNGPQHQLFIGRSVSLMDNVHNADSEQYSSMLMSPVSTKGKKKMKLKKRIFGGSPSFKRPKSPPSMADVVDNKRMKSDMISPFQTATTTFPTIPSLNRQSSVPMYMDNSKQYSEKLYRCSSESQVSSRCNSESQVSIMSALSKSSTSDEKLTGDLSRPLELPTIDGGKHPDISAISHDTLSDLMKGKYNHCVNSFKILDCRYPYEYEGGHIVGAESWSSPQMVLDELAKQCGTACIPNECEKRDILIFHCEFSANRGPKTYRLMREKDRASSTNYPALHYPEIYLLEGGYKDFYNQYPELCTSEGYTMMLDPRHSENLKHFRAKSKSWAAENKKSSGRGPMRTGLRRMNLI
ncbi:unnamed protein product, partial [Meganyctiphanes norvegica]